MFSTKNVPTIINSYMRKPKKFHYIYKITRFDGKYYIGLHSTNNLDDGYFGSGKRLWRSIKKYGKDAHTKEIIEFLPTREELKSREKEIVNQECISDPLCMNIALGGTGGDIIAAAGKTYIELYGEERAVAISTSISLSTKGKTNKHTSDGKKRIGNAVSKRQHNKSYEEQFGTEISNKRKERLSEAVSGSGNPFFGKHHSEETKHHCSELAKERKNWVINKRRVIIEVQSDDRWFTFLFGINGLNDEIGISSYHIRSALKTGISVRGYTFKIIEAYTQSTYVKTPAHHKS